MKRWAVFFGLFMVLIIILADTGHMGALPKVYDFPYGDKVGHFTLFGLLSFVINLSVFEARPFADKRRLAVITSLVLALFIGFEEYSQRFFHTRQSDIFDFLASCAGVTFFAWLAYRLKARNTAPPCPCNVQSYGINGRCPSVCSIGMRISPQSTNDRESCRVLSSLLQGRIFSDDTTHSIALKTESATSCNAFSYFFTYPSMIPYL